MYPERKPDRYCSRCLRKAEVLVMARVDGWKAERTCLGCLSDLRKSGSTVRVESR
jgi:hypothetical protein